MCIDYNNTKNILQAKKGGNIESFEGLRLALDNIRNNAAAKDRFKFFKLRYTAAEIAVNHRVKICGKYHYKDEKIEVWKGENNKAHFKNLIYCSSVWACPVCRYKIQEARRLEVMTILKEAQKQGKQMSFGTFTVKHTKKYRQSDITKGFKEINEAWRKIMSIRHVKELKNKYQIGYIKSYDTRYNKINGFHNHLHIIIISESHETCEEYFNVIKKEWLKRFEGTKGINIVYEKVYNGSDKEKLTEYITKLGLSYEIVNSENAKKSKTSIAPLDCLDLIQKKEFTEYTEAELIKIYNEYITGTKGLRSMTFSRGLKKEYGIKEKTDEEIVSNADKLTEYIMTVTDEIYSFLQKQKKEYLILRAVDKYLNEKINSLELAVMEELKNESCALELTKDNRLILNDIYKGNYQENLERCNRGRQVKEEINEMGFDKIVEELNEMYNKN